MKRRPGRRIAALAALAAIASIAVFRPDRAARVAAGVTAHNLCSAVFVSGLEADATFAELVSPLVGGVVARLLDYRVDRDGRGVDASFARVFSARARFTPGYGCRLQYPDDTPLVALDAGAPQSTAVAPPADAKLAAALERVFAEVPGAPVKRVKAVVVMRDGKVVAERYAPGIGVHTPLLSYSVAKSFTNALLAILVRQDRLHVEQPVGAPEWLAPGDPRSTITIEDLLRMRSGLDAAESGSGFAPSNRMLYTRSDMAAFAADHALKKAPGEAWEYTSSNTLILDRLIGRTIGGGAAGLVAFARAELFAPLGMSNVTMEVDGSGVFVGASYVYASARDFARFGQLFADDGVAPDGRRILPPGWVDWSRRSTLGTPYGAGFWTNDGASEWAALRVRNGFPKDGLFASGNLGQRIYIVPSRRLVVARFGYSAPPDFGIGDDLGLIAAALAVTAGGVPKP